MMFRYKHPGKIYHLGKYTTSEREIKDLGKGWVLISLAFAIVMSGMSSTGEFFYNLVIAAVTVGTGFLLHELGHKIVAQRFGLKAEFRSFDTMLVLALFMSFFGFLFAAPGAVMIQGRVMRRENGKISVAGPWINIVLSAIFLILWMTVPMLTKMWQYGYFINAWLALFNMIPFGMFDGKKVFAWDKTVYWLTVAAAFGLLLVQNILV